VTPVAAWLWTRLDQPGHDGCRLLRLVSGWRLVGAAAFREGRKPCHLSYLVDADAAWRTRGARVTGYVGSAAVDLRLRRGRGDRWRVDGEPVAAADGCVDLDLGFTPATNLMAIRRLALRVGEQAEAPAAYLEVPRLRVVRLAQNYTRTARFEYDYASPDAGYRGTLQVDRFGGIMDYPGVFQRVDD
jgi:hypothetical protein